MAVTKSTKRLNTVLVPKSSSNTYTIQIHAHPRTNAPTPYLHSNNQIFELTSISSEPSTRGGRPRPQLEQVSTGKARSFFFQSESESNDDLVVSSAVLTVCTPMNPLFFALPALLSCQAHFLSADMIHDALESPKFTPSECVAPLEYAGFESLISLICDRSEPPLDTHLKLSDSKLFSLLDKLVDRVLNGSGIPEQMKQQMVIEPLTPPKLGASAPEDMVKIALERVAMSLVCSYVPEELCFRYFKTRNFELLDKYITSIKTERENAQEQQMALLNPGTNRKRGALDELPGENKKSKATKTRGQRVLEKIDKTGIKSLTSFFKPAAKKKTENSS